MTTSDESTGEFSEQQIRKWKAQVAMQRRKLFGDLREPKVDHVAIAKADMEQRKREEEELKKQTQHRFFYGAG